MRERERKQRSSRMEKCLLFGFVLSFLIFLFSCERPPNLKNTVNMCKSMKETTSEPGVCSALKFFLSLFISL